MDQPCDKAILSISLTVTGFMTGLKVSEKSTPGVWWKPLATRRALCLFREPSELCLTLKIHLHPIGVFF